MAASSRFATVSEDDFALKCFFFLFFEIITGVFILKQLFDSGSVIIGEYSPIITSLRRIIVKYCCFVPLPLSNQSLLPCRCPGCPKKVPLISMTKIA